MGFELSKREYMGAIVSGQTRDMGKNVDYLMKVSVDAVMTNSIPGLWNELRDETKKFEAMYNFLEIENDEDKRKVYYYSAIRTLIEFQGMLDQRYQELYSQKEYRSYKHLYPALQCLAEFNMVSHGELADKLQISKHNLSNFIKRTQKYGLWSVEHHGKQCYYVITAKGKSAYKDYLLTDAYQDKDRITEMMIFFVGLLSKEMEKAEPCTDNVTFEMAKKYGKGISLFSSEMLKHKLDVIFLKREVGAKRKWRKIKEERESWDDYHGENMIYDIPDYSYNTAEMIYQ